MNDRNDSLGYICVCMDEIPHDFQPLNFYGENISNGSILGIREIFLYLANLRKSEEKLIALSNIIEEWECNTGDDEANGESLRNSLASVIDEQYVRVFASYIFVSRKIEEDDIFTLIKTACMMASRYAECLCDPYQIQPSGMENRDIVTAIIGSCDDVGLAFDTEYHPIMGYCGETFTYLDSLVFKDLLSVVNMAVLNILKNEIIIRKCRNCGDYFIPASRSDEVYCNKLFANGKTCKNVGYDVRIKGDDILREYRRKYKTQNARKQRNSHIADISYRFERWKIFAKKCVKACQEGEITLDEMSNQISGKEWMTKTK